MDLSGDWELRLDPNDEGVQAEWYSTRWESASDLELPGSLQAQGFGAVPGVNTSWTGVIVDRSYYEEDRYAPYRGAGNIKFPFWYQPERVYCGAAWYRRRFTVPPEWQGKPWYLYLERCHWTSRLWVDGVEQGFAESLSTPHCHRVLLEQSSEVCLTLCVDNRRWVDVGPNAHSISDHTQTNWNGIVGAIRAEPELPVRFENVEIYPDPQNHCAKVCFAIFPQFPESGTVKATVSGPGFDEGLIPAVEISVAGKLAEPQSFEISIDLGPQCRFWAPQTPFLYELTLTGSFEFGLAERRERFGMVKITTQGRQILLNNRPVFLRGTLDCAIFPHTGYPPTDVDSWRRILTACKSHGLNHVRFHSWCPPEAAFVVGDELGLIFQVECAAWPNTTTSVGEGHPVDGWLYREGERIVSTYGNHPCFLLMACGNEPAGPAQNYDNRYHVEPWLAMGADYLGPWCAYWRTRDPRRLHTSAGGWPKVSQTDFHNVPEPRIQRWGEELNSIINHQPPCSDYNWEQIIEKDKPTVSHEVGQWCAYPDFREIEKMTGFLKAKNFEIFYEFLEQKGIEDQAVDFLNASGRLQTLCYKAEIEAALRTPGFGGFQLLGLQDFPGQGTALVGVLNTFWESKSYVTSEGFREFCHDTVPLAVLPRHLYVGGDELKTNVLLSHFGVENLDDLSMTWSLRNRETSINLEGAFPLMTVVAGTLHDVGTLSIKLPDVPHATACELLITSSMHALKNRWSILIVPRTLPAVNMSDCHICHEWTPEVLKQLNEGGKVWLQLPSNTIETEIQSGFSSIFWNTAWTKNQAPHTMGILCDPGHPAFAEFPTGPYSDWQWWSPTTHSRVMELDRLVGEVQPLIRMVPNWFDPKPLALAFEAKIGFGSLLVTSIDFEEGGGGDYALRQLRYSLARYFTSENFSPAAELDPASLSLLFCSE